MRASLGDNPRNAQCGAPVLPHGAVLWQGCRVIYFTRLAKPALAAFAALALMGNTVKDEAWELMEDGKEAEAFALVEKGAAQGDAAAIDYLAWFYEYGRVVEPDAKRAAQLYRQAAELEEPHAQWRLGVMIDEGEAQGTAKEAVELFRRSAAQQYTNAMSSLAIMYIAGRGVERDYTQARLNYEMAAMAGSSHALGGLGSLYANGQGVDEDIETGAGYWAIASQLGSERAQGFLLNATREMDDAQRSRIAARADEIAGIYGYEMTFDPRALGGKAIRQERQEGKAVPAKRRFEK